MAGKLSHRTLPRSDLPLPSDLDNRAGRESVSGVGARRDTEFFRAAAAQWNCLALESRVLRSDERRSTLANREPSAAFWSNGGRRNRQHRLLHGPDAGAAGGVWRRFL